MQQLFNFFIKNKIFVLFLLLFSIAISLTIKSHQFHRTKLLNSSNYIIGSIYGLSNSVSQYFHLVKENKLLLEENSKIKSQLFNQTKYSTIDPVLEQRFNLNPAIVYKNSYSLKNNYITLNKGLKDGINEDYGVVTSKGIVGVIDKTSSKYCRVLSILNSNSKINVKLKKTNHFGTLSWDSKSAGIVQLNDIQDVVKLTIGDSVTTSGFSSIFPANIPVGTISSYRLNDTKDLYVIDVKLFNDMTNLEHVYIIKNTDFNEIDNLNQYDE